MCVGGVRGQSRVWKITQLTRFSPPSSSAPGAGCVFRSHVFLAILKCFSSPRQARLTLPNIFLFGCHFVFVKIFCIQILTNISFNIFCTFWYRRANNRQIGFILLLSGDSQRKIFVSAPSDESSSHVSVTCDKWALMSCSGEHAALQLQFGEPPPPGPDIWQCQGHGEPLQPPVAGVRHD